MRLTALLNLRSGLGLVYVTVYTIITTPEKILLLYATPGQRFTSRYKVSWYQVHINV
mgnify:CR=1 FL=1